MLPDGAPRCPVCHTAFGAPPPRPSAAQERRRREARQRQNAAAQTVNAAAQPFSQDLPEGTLLNGGHYHLGPVLGRGSFGTTFRAVDKQLARLVAIKEFFPEGSVRQGSTIVPPASMGRAAFEQERAAFTREATVLARFHRPGIVAVYDVFEENDTAYMVMEYVAGKTLVQLLQERGGPLPPADAVRYILAVADALGAVHEQHLLHRDVKPGNIIVTSTGEAVLIDFGAARSFDRYQRTTAMTAIGTPGYAPLEQWGSSGRFGPASDVYALAATLYHLLTGMMPPSAADRAINDALVPPRTLVPAVPPPVNDAVVAALAVAMDARPQTMALFAQGLRAGLYGTLPGAQVATAARSSYGPVRAATAPAPVPSLPRRTVQPQPASPAAQSTPARPAPVVAARSETPATAVSPAPAPARGEATVLAQPVAQPGLPAPLQRRTGLLSSDTGKAVLKNAALFPLAPPVFAGSMLLLALGTPALAVSSVMLPPERRHYARRALRRSARTGAKGVALSAKWLTAFVATVSAAGMVAVSAPVIILGVMAFNASGAQGRNARRYARRQRRMQRRTP